MRFSTVSVLLLAGLTGSAAAQDLLVVKYSPDRLARIDGTTGLIVDPDHLNVSALAGIPGGVTIGIGAAVSTPTGEIWITSYLNQAIYRFSMDGGLYFGTFAQSPGAATSASLIGDSLWVTTWSSVFGQGVLEYDATTRQPLGFVPLTQPTGVIEYEGKVIASTWSAGLYELDGATHSVAGLFSMPSGRSDAMSVGVDGNLYIASTSLPGFHVVDPTGVVLQQVALGSSGIGGPSGIAQLPDGRILLNGSHGARIYDPVSATVVVVDTATGGEIATFGGSVGTSYCAANPNSLGAPGKVAAIGSPVAGHAILALRATELPPNQFGMFITSMTQGFSPGVGGSQGNLCLASPIGRYNGPGMVQSSGAYGRLALTLELAATPTPTGPVSITSGQTWNFQAWYRDLNPAPTSNFTDAVSLTFL